LKAQQELDRVKQHIVQKKAAAEAEDEAFRMSIRAPNIQERWAALPIGPPPSPPLSHPKGPQHCTSASSPFNKNNSSPPPPLSPHAAGHDGGAARPQRARRPRPRPQLRLRRH
jgi:hypothetical protein